MYLILNMVWYYCACVLWLYLHMRIEGKRRDRKRGSPSVNKAYFDDSLPFKGEANQDQTCGVVEFSTYCLRIVCTCSQSRDWCATARAPVQSLKQLQWGMHGVPSHALQGLRCILRIRLDLSWSIWIFSPPCKSAHHAGQSQANSCCSCALVCTGRLDKRTQWRGTGSMTSNKLWPANHENESHHQGYQPNTFNCQFASNYSEIRSWPMLTQTTLVTYSAFSIYKASSAFVQNTDKCHY
jgi:hypothetical protein